jgi:hypothetical protein
MNSIKQKSKNLIIDQNTLGWESVAKNWHKVSWPRRPSESEIQKIIPLIEQQILKGESAIFGATPEYRKSIIELKNKHKLDTNNTCLIEKSQISYKYMNKILKNDFKTNPKNEVLLEVDWEEFNAPKNTFSLMWGDMIIGYLQTKERLKAFLENCYNMLTANGKIVLREFMAQNIEYTIDEIRHLPISVDLKRWTYIFKKGFATENSTFYEEKLAYNLLNKAGDTKVFRTCAIFPRTRLFIGLEEFKTIVTKAGFKLYIAIEPSSKDYPKPGLFILKKQ